MRIGPLWKSINLCWSTYFWIYFLYANEVLVLHFWHWIFFSLESNNIGMHLVYWSWCQCNLVKLFFCLYFFFLIIGSSCGSFLPNTFCYWRISSTTPYLVRCSWLYHCINTESYVITFHYCQVSWPWGHAGRYMAYGISQKAWYVRWPVLWW